MGESGGARPRQQVIAGLPGDDRPRVARPPLARLRLELDDEQRSRALAPPIESAALPGTGGRLRSQPEDFEVEEQLGFEADGREGRHLLITLDKVGVNTKEALARVARHCRLPAVEFGVAGLKDRHARTRQWISAPAHARERLTDFSDDAISLGTPLPHSAKLRRGHAAGNRFRIVVRAATPDWASRLGAKLEALDGWVANVYGEQRFGHGGKNLDEGLRRLSRPHRARDSDFYVNAAQSGIFNLYAAARLASSHAREAIKGDLLLDRDKKLLATTGPLGRRELLDKGWSVTGPMIGGSVERPTLDTPAGELERSILETLGVGESHFRSWGKRVRGARRRLHAPFTLHELSAIADGDGYRLDFTLPTGAYATSLLREFMSGRSTLEPSDESKTRPAE